MKVAFRTDASVTIGTGHVMRCLTLAQLLKERGAEIRFICREHPGDLVALIEGKGFSVQRLPKGKGEYGTASGDLRHSAWLDVPWQQDAAETAAVSGAPLDLLIVDHYAIDWRWEELLRPQAEKIMVIDDLADRRHDCDILLDQNLGHSADAYLPLVPKGCTLLIGPQYSLLRPEFAALRGDSLKRRRTRPFEQMLITMGGTDKDNVTGAVLNALRHCRLPEGCRINVVMGGGAPWLESVRETARALPWEVEVLVDVADMAQLMAQSDLAIGAAGGTSWERCCLGLPTVMLVLAENQELAARELERSGAAIVLERQWQPRQLQSVLHSLAGSPALLWDMAESAAAVTDGTGAAAVLERLVRMEQA